MRELLRDDGFQIALVVGLGLSGVVALLHRRRLTVPVGFQAGAASAIAALVALFVTHRRAMLSLLGLALVAIGAVATRRLRRRWTIAAVVPGAVLLALALDAPVPGWAAVTCFGAITVIVPCAVAVDGSVPRILPVLLAATAIGVWATTPDTEHTRVLVGALVGVAVLVLDRRLGAGAGGVAATVALMVWALTVDGYPRASAIIGALGCFGLVVLLPVAGRTRFPSTTVRIIVVFAVQGGIAFVCSRVAGLRTSAVASVTVVAAAWAIAGAALRLVVRGSRH